MEFVPGGLLYDLCNGMKGVGEDGGRFFLNQLLNVLDYFNKKGIVHRDLKLENVLIDRNLNLKVADFGFATYKSIHNLKSYRGTLTYMAPEIKQGKVYNGKHTDIFSVGVILFAIVLGIFPFREATMQDPFYKLLVEGSYAKYWKKIGGEHLSGDLKSLF